MSEIIKMFCNCIGVYEIFMAVIVSLWFFIVFITDECDFGYDIFASMK